MVFLEALEQHVLGVLVRNVPDHDGRPAVVLDPVEVDHVGSGFLEGDGSSVAHCWGLEVVVKTIRHLHHHWHVARRVTCVHPARHLGSFCLRSCVAGGNGVGTVLCVLRDDSHAGVDYRADHLILLFAFGRLPALFGLVVRVDPRLLFVLILEQQDGVVKGLLAVRWHLPLIPARHA